MAQNLEELFQDIPFDEAYKTTMEHDKWIKTYKSQGAILNGDRPLDIEYTNLMTKAAKYQLQFSMKELFAILGRSLEEQENRG